jgi:hypothetical protein
LSYDEELRFKRLTALNWREPDVPTYSFPVTESQWGEVFMAPRLDAAVPLEIIRLFEIARGCMLQAWHFYPLLTLGMQQLTRVLEAAVRAKCRELGCEVERYSGNLEALRQRGIIPQEEFSCWEAGRWLRNEFSHLDADRPILVDPGSAHGQLQLTADRINHLFKASN